MTFIAAAIIGGTAAIGGAVYASNKTAGAAKSAAKVSSKATQQSSQLQYDLGMKSLEMQKPFYDTAYQLLPEARRTGSLAYSLYPKLIKEAQDYKTNPATLASLSTGTGAINSALAARGLYGSGAALSAIGNTTTNILNNAQNERFNRLLGLAGIGMNVGQGVLNSGQNASSNMSATLGNTGSGMANTMMQGAGLQGGYIMNAGNAQAEMGQNIGGTIAGLAGGYAKNAALADYLKKPAATGKDLTSYSI